MQDVLMIVIDSVFEEVLNSTPDVCPFLHSIANRSLRFNNVFSQGPYTEAGTKGLLCGENTLDKEGYLFRYSRASNFISSVFKDSGYDTTSIIYPTTLYNEPIIEKLDHIYHTSVFIPSVFWNQKLVFYKTVLEKRPFTDDEYERIANLVKDVLNYWFYSVDTENHSQNTILFDKYNKNYPYKEIFDYVLREKQKFEEDNRAYIDELFLTDGLALKIDTFAKTDFIQTSALKQVIKRKKRFCQKLVYRQRHIALRQLKEYMHILRRGKSLSEKKNIMKVWLRYLLESNDIYKVSKSKDFKLLLSAGAQLDFASDCLLSDSKGPKFVMAHVEEPHYFNSFFSYDSNNLKLLEEEFKYAEEFLDTVDFQQYNGFLYYDLAIRYVDLQIKKVFEKLQKKGKLDNTLVVITADHGSSYTGRFLRSNRVINFHKENYHIPFIIYNSEIVGRSFSGLSSNIDIIPTVLSILGIKIPESLSGRDIVSEGGRNCVFIEYMGSGCPDIHLRPVWLAVRSEAYQIAYVGLLEEEFSERNIVSIYDLKNDFNEDNNMSGKADLNNDEVKWLKNKLEERFISLKQQYGM